MSRLRPWKRQARWWGSRTSNPVQGTEGCPGWVRFPCASAISVLPWGLGDESLLLKAAFDLRATALTLTALLPGKKVFRIPPLVASSTLLQHARHIIQGGPYGSKHSRATYEAPLRLHGPHTDQSDTEKPENRYPLPSLSPIVSIASPATPAIYLLEKHLPLPLQQLCPSRRPPPSDPHQNRTPQVLQVRTF